MMMMMMMMMLMIITVNVLVNNDEQITAMKARHIDLPMNVIRRNSFLDQRFHVNNINNNNNYNVRRVNVIHCI